MKQKTEPKERLQIYWEEGKVSYTNKQHPISAEEAMSRAREGKYSGVDADWSPRSLIPVDAFLEMQKQKAEFEKAGRSAREETAIFDGRSEKFFLEGDLQRGYTPDNFMWHCASNGIIPTILPYTENIGQMQEVMKIRSSIVSIVQKGYSCK